MQKFSAVTRMFFKPFEFVFNNTNSDTCFIIGLSIFNFFLILSVAATTPILILEIFQGDITGTIFLVITISTTGLVIISTAIGIVCAAIEIVATALIKVAEFTLNKLYDLASNINNWFTRPNKSEVQQTLNPTATLDPTNISEIDPDAMAPETHKTKFGFSIYKQKLTGYPLDCDKEASYEDMPKLDTDKSNNSPRPSNHSGSSQVISF